MKELTGWTKKSYGDTLTSVKGNPVPSTTSHTKDGYEIKTVKGYKSNGKLKFTSIELYKDNRLISVDHKNVADAANQAAILMSLQ